MRGLNRGTLEHMWIGCLVLPLTLSGCSGGGGSKEAQSTGEQKTVTVPSPTHPNTSTASDGRAKTGPPIGAFPQTLKDALGETVTVSRPPGRIVSLSPGTTSTLFAIGAGDRIVGDTLYDNDPPQAKKIPHVGDLINPSSEKILALKPDLVVASRGNSLKALNSLKRVGLTLFAVDPKSLKDVVQLVRTLGKLTGASKAEQVAREMEQRIRAVQEKTRPYLSKSVTGLVEISHDPLFLAGPEGFVGDLFRTAGGKNLAPSSPTGFPAVSSEAIISANPDAYFLSDGATPDQIARRPGWSRLKAVTAHRVYSLDSNVLNRPAPGIVSALEQIARDLYPQAFQQH